MCLCCAPEAMRTSDLAGVPADHGVHDDREAELLANGQAFVRRHLTIDIHAHPGRFFMHGAVETPLARELGAPFPERTIADMRIGNVGAAVFALVADHLLLAATARGLRAVREFRPGEAYADYLRQLAVVERLAQAGGLRPAHAGETSSDMDPFAALPMLSVEGGDFIENRLERIAEARARGVGSITIVHYHTNQIGDTQTETPVHAGITRLGREIIAAMEEAGVVVDLAHASEETCAAVCAIARRPMLISHSNVRRPGQEHPRLISLDHARMVTRAGGVIGAVPAGFDQDRFDDYIDTILYMVDALGADHVAVGTDMDYTFRPVMSSYRDWPRLVGSLLDRGLEDAALAKVMGGNWLRVMGGNGASIEP